MKISKNCVELIKQFEGCVLSAYKPVPTEKYWTIGYGHYGADVAEGMKISHAQAELILIDDLAKFEAKVNKYSKYNWTQNEFDALVSFAFNVGSIDQLTAKGTRSKEVIASKILEYNKAGGKVLNGLTRRRQAEHDLFTSGATWTRKTLRVNDKGYLVTELQTMLSELKYPVGSIDGVFGSKTLNSVKMFQKDNGLAVDGIVGTRTWAKLDDKPTSNPIVTYSLKKDGNARISANFTVKEFACKDGSDAILIDADFVKKYIQQIRNHFKAPVTINSAYRTESYNKKVGGASASYHVKGQAFDIVVKGVTPQEVARYAYSLGVTGIIQYNTFVHLDNRKTPYYAINNNGKVTKVSKW